MKQNERILVYLVTGFLAVILVVAVFFGREGQAAGKPDIDNTVRGLGQILDQKPLPGEPVAGGESTDSGSTGSQPPDTGAEPETGEPGDSAIDGKKGDQEGDIKLPPLVASMPVAAAERVAQLLGSSRRDRTVRIVRATAGDSLDSLVQRWCGKRGGYLEEARSLNEDLTILRIDQIVVVPWVDDQVVLAAYEARQPKLLAVDSGRPEPAIAQGTPAPTFQVPGGKAAVPLNGSAPPGNPPAAGDYYVVEPNDSLWKIAAKRYGNRKADAMIREIRKLNPNLRGDTLHPKQRLLMPSGT